MLRLTLPVLLHAFSARACTGVKVANLFGSYGTKAVAMALLGANVTVFDLSSGNARYAQELAAAAGVPLRYVVTDVLKLQEQELTGRLTAQCAAWHGE